MRSSNTLVDLIGTPDNLELIRLLAAVGVIFGHSFALSMFGHSGVPAPISQILPGTYSGSIAVEVFFFVSGMLITNSLLRRPHLGQFLKSRALRVLPAFLVMLLITTLLMAPFFSQLGWTEFVSHAETRRYFLSVACFDLCPDFPASWTLPATFIDHKNSALNGSLWSLFDEVKLYFFSAAGILLLAYRRWWWGAILAITFLAYLLTKGALMSADAFAFNAAAMYALGMLVRFYAHQIQISALPLLVSILLVYFFRFTPAAHLVYALLIASAVLYFAYGAALPKLRLPGDYSYGLFLWGYPIQQMLSSLWPTLGPYRFFVVSLTITAVFAVASWHWIEKPALRWKSRRGGVQAAPSAPAI